MPIEPRTGAPHTDPHQSTPSPPPAPPRRQAKHSHHDRHHVRRDPHAEVPARVLPGHRGRRARSGPRGKWAGCRAPRPPAGRRSSRRRQSPAARTRSPAPGRCCPVGASAAAADRGGATPPGRLASSRRCRCWCRLRQQPPGGASARTARVTRHTTHPAAATRCTSQNPMTLQMSRDIARPWRRHRRHRNGRGGEGPRGSEATGLRFVRFRRRLHHVPLAPAGRRKIPVHIGVV
jgi:hypothetical protein